MSGETTRVGSGRRERRGGMQPSGCAACGDAPCRLRPWAKETLTVALAGQPNVGKSTVFNILTGSTEHVGNWPGKTVEQKTGVCHYNGTELHIVDLPGTYSLTANSPEERIARDFIIREHPDVVVVIVDAAALERGLYLVAEILALPAPVVLGVNMVDVAERQGVRIEPDVLEAALGIPVVPMTAAKNRGVQALLQAIGRVIEDPSAAAPRRPVIRADHQDVLAALLRLIEGSVPEPYPSDWVALKLLEGDQELTTVMREHLDDDRWAQVHAILLQHEDAILAVAGGRYEWIGRMVRAAVVRPRIGQVMLTDRLDRYATHPVWGLLILLGMLGLAFWATYAVGTPMQRILDTYLVRAGADHLRSALVGAPAWLVELLATGVLGGAGTVITFVPILAIFFAFLALLEDVGYMARGAYVMDRYMHAMGLHGKSFLPLCLGFGCNVPAVMGARTIDAPRARLLTILLAPLVPCTARMAVITVLVPIFFSRHAALVTWGLMGLSLVALAVVGVVLHKAVLGGEHVAFIMELPLYHVPNIRTVGMSVWQRTVRFVRKAGTVIVVVSVVVWALSVLPGGSIESSYLAAAARLLAPIGALMGMSWRMMVALLGGFVAKENTIAILGVLYGAGKDGASLTAALSGTLAPAAALAFLVVQLLFIPCAATVAAIRQETGSWRLTAFSVVLMLVLSLSLGIATYQGAVHVGWGV
jgi:ferrous iron transport protein B